jgi:hypothetical protein
MLDLGLDPSAILEPATNATASEQSLLFFCLPGAVRNVDWASLDGILLSYESSLWALPLITEYTAFRGKLFATEPIVEIAR